MQAQACRSLVSLTCNDASLLHHTHTHTHTHLRACASRGCEYLYFSLSLSLSHTHTREREREREWSARVCVIHRFIHTHHTIHTCAHGLRGFVSTVAPLSLSLSLSPARMGCEGLLVAIEALVQAMRAPCERGRAGEVVGEFDQRPARLLALARCSTFARRRASIAPRAPILTSAAILLTSLQARLTSDLHACSRSRGARPSPVATGAPRDGGRRRCP